MLLVDLAFIYLLVLYGKSWAARRYIETFPRLKKEIHLEDVAIFQPILSGDPTLEQTLETNLSPLDRATFYWLVDDDDSSAHAIVDALRKRHPEAAIVKYSYPFAPEGVNPKLFKLNQALSFCQQRYCVVLDDDTTLPYSTLEGLLAALEYCDLATGLPLYRSDGNFPSALLAAFVNNNASMTYLSTLSFMNPITINGMCFAFQHTDAERWGRFQSVLHHLTDDLAVAGMILAQGGTIRQIPDRQVIRTHLPDIASYFRQMHRWHVFANVLFVQQPLWIKALLIVLHGLPPLLLAAICVSWFFFPSLLWGGIVFCTLTLRHCIIAKHSGQQESGNVRMLLFSLISELLQSVHYLHALLDRRIRWRSRFYRVYASNRFESE